jgi:hypothetical protein
MATDFALSIAVTSSRISASISRFRRVVEDFQPLHPAVTEFAAFAFQVLGRFRRSPGIGQHLWRLRRTDSGASEFVPAAELTIILTGDNNYRGSFLSGLVLFRTMNLIRIHTRLESETISIPELRPLVGKQVEITICEQPSPGAVEATSSIPFPLRDSVLRYDEPFAPVAESNWEATH